MIPRTAAQRRTPPRKDEETEKIIESSTGNHSPNRVNGASNAKSSKKKKSNKLSWAQGVLKRKWRNHNIVLILLLSYCVFELHVWRNQSQKKTYIEQRRSEAMRGNSAVQPNTSPREASFIVSKDNAIVPDSVVPQRRQIQPESLDIFKERKCVPIHPNAENTVYPFCNVVHEIGMDHLEYLSKGTKRATFIVKDTLGNKLVLKVLTWERSKFYEQNFEKQRKDAMAMEALTSSHYTLKIYAFCGVAQLLELGEGGTVHDIIKRSKLQGNSLLPPIDKLRIAYQLSTAVADMHEIGRIANRDLCCHQFIMVDGVYKVNDFHLAQFFERDVNNHTCSTNPYTYPKSHAPEEYAKSKYIFGDSADVYMVGNVMYGVLTYRWLFESKSNSEAKSMIIKGQRSPFPEELQNSTDPAVKAMMQAINLCWTHKVKERPQARYVSNYLFQELKKIDDSTRKNDVVRVNLPPPGKNYRYTDTDFYKNLY